MKHFKLVFMWCLLCSVLSQGQIFVWQNPNLKDSLKRDSLLAAKLEREVFQRDTLNFIKNQHRYTEEVKISAPTRHFLENIDTQGSIIRGISFGNAQGSAMQSSMDLQISGRLSPDISILASISDHNLPIQADGYTQTLEEFDKVYIQLGIKQHTTIKAGHLDLNDDQTYFGKYQRRSLGLALNTQWGNENKTTLHLSGGVARSEFHRMRFQGREGNQGPYRLLGKNGEVFITIISGSEQVFIDGVLLKRGENLDYTINYNTGEITFTSFRPIYSQNFITVSYNYTNRNYTRFLATGGIEHQRERLKLGLDWFLESDNKNAPLALELSDADRKILAQAGDRQALMFAPSGVVTPYDVNKILYRKISTASGDYYEFSTDETETLYTVTFTYSGTGKGDYELKQTTNNGRVFQYVGAHRGDYSALRKLPAPQNTQVLSTHAEYALPKGKIAADVSMSWYNANLFSPTAGQRGYATRIMAEKTFRKGNWSGKPSLEFQHINANFHILDRINSVEFARDFNLSQEFNQRTQNRLIFSFDNDWAQGSFLHYQLNLLNEQGTYQGLKNDLDFKWLKNQWEAQGHLSLLRSQSPVEDTRFLKSGVELIYKGKKGFWSAGAETEHNEKHLNAQNLLDTSSFSWREVFIKKELKTDKKAWLSAKIYWRENDSVQVNQLTHKNQILGIVSENEWIKTERTTLNTQFHYRKIFPKDGAQGNQDFLVGNIVYHQQWFQNGMRLQAFYELGNGQEAQREFQYLKVNDGQGIYKWTDYNGDGIQQIDEFEIAEYADLAQYIRVYTNTIKYLPSNKNKLQLAVFLNPSAMFNSENPFLKRWNFNLSFLSENAYYKQDKALVWNPFERQLNQILKQQNLLATAQFSPNATSGWNASYRLILNHHILKANFSQEEKQQHTHFINLGYKISPALRADWENQWQQIQNHSELFSSRDYQLNEWSTRPKLTYQLTDALQAEASSALTHKQRTDGIERLKALEWTGSLQWEHRNTALRGSFSFINNDFSGQSFSIVGNQMLNGLKAGKNQVWSVFWQQAINSFLRLNLSYEGRNSGQRTIHTGSVQVKASF